MDVGANFYASGIELYCKNKERYRIRVPLQPSDFEIIKQKAPNAIWGYSKKKHRLAKRDWPKFLEEGKFL